MFKNRFRNYYFWHPNYWSKVWRVIASLFVIILMSATVPVFICLWQNINSNLALKFAEFDDVYVYNRLSEVLRLKTTVQDQEKLFRHLRCQESTALNCVQVSGSFIDKNTVAALQSTLPRQRVMAVEKNCLSCHHDKKNHLVLWKLESSSKSGLSMVILSLKITLLILCTGIFTVFAFWLWIFLRSLVVSRSKNEIVQEYVVVSLRYSESAKNAVEKFIDKYYFNIYQKMKMLLGFAPNGLIRYEQIDNSLYFLISSRSFFALIEKLSLLEFTQDLSTTGLTFSALQFNHRFTHIRSYHALQLSALIMNKLKSDVLLFDANLVESELNLKMKTQYREKMKSAKYQNGKRMLPLFWIKWQDFRQHK